MCQPGKQPVLTQKEGEQDVEEDSFDCENNEGYKSIVSSVITDLHLFYPAWDEMIISLSNYIVNETSYSYDVIMNILKYF